jgi:hypothetical protein
MCERRTYPNPSRVAFWRGGRRSTFNLLRQGFSGFASRRPGRRLSAFSRTVNTTRDFSCYRYGPQSAGMLFRNERIWILFALGLHVQICAVSALGERRQTMPSRWKKLKSEPFGT